MCFRRSKKKDPSLIESEEALTDAAKQLKKTKSKDSEVKRLAREMRELRNRNHFADRLQKIMEGGMDLDDE